MNVASIIQGLILWTLNIIIAVMIAFVLAAFLAGCETAAPTTRSTAVLPPVDKGAMQPYAETVTEPEVYQPTPEVLSTSDAGLSTDERIVELIATADPAPTDVRRKKKNVRVIRPRDMSPAEWEATER